MSDLKTKLAEAQEGRRLSSEQAAKVDDRTPNDPKYWRNYIMNGRPIPGRQNPNPSSNSTIPTANVDGTPLTAKELAENIRGFLSKDSQR